MTNKEAIKELEEIKPAVDNVFTFSANRKAEAIDQAIKVLKCVDMPFIRANIPATDEGLNSLKKLIEDQMEHSKAVLLPYYCELLTPFAIPKEPADNAKWILLGPGDPYVVKCPICNMSYYNISNFCANCGADMRKEGKP